MTGGWALLGLISPDPKAEALAFFEERWSQVKKNFLLTMKRDLTSEEIAKMSTIADGFRKRVRSVASRILPSLTRLVGRQVRVHLHPVRGEGGQPGRVSTRPGGEGGEGKHAIQTSSQSHVNLGPL